MSAGFPDFTLKGASAIDDLASEVILTAGTQVIDITDLITPSHNGLLFVWVAALAYLGGGVLVTVDAVLNGVRLVPTTVVADGGQAIVPFPGPYITDNVGNTCNLSVTLPAGTPGPAAGTLLVFGINATPLSVPAIRRQLIGIGDTSGNKTVNAGTTTVVLPAPPIGSYYRIKALGWSLNVAPAAATKVIWQRADTGAVLLGTSIPVAASQQSQIITDFQADFGISANNQTSLNVPCSVVFELWAV